MEDDYLMFEEYLMVGLIGEIDYWCEKKINLVWWRENCLVEEIWDIYKDISWWIIDCCLKKFYFCYKNCLYVVGNVVVV